MAVSMHIPLTSCLLFHYWAEQLVWHIIKDSNYGKFRETSTQFTIIVSFIYRENLLTLLR